MRNLSPGSYVFCIAALLMQVSLASAETWKTFSFRQPDNAPLQIDTDYLVQRGDLVEVRIKAKQEKNPLLFLLPDSEVEERYLLNCDANKYAFVYQKVTKLNQATVALDLLPSAAVLIDIPKGSIAAGAAAWACPDYKKKIAVSSTPAATTAPSVPPPPAQVQAGTGNWGFVSNSRDNQEAYWVDIDSLAVDQGVASFWVRLTLQSPRTETGFTYVSSMTRVKTNCTSQHLDGGATTFYDANGRTVGPGSAPGNIDAPPGSIGRAVYDAACSYARGGDLGKSQIFPKGINDASVDLRELPDAHVVSGTLYIDAKSAYHDAGKGIAVAKIAIMRIGPQEKPATDNTKFYFGTSVINCTAHTSAYLASETYDPFKRLVQSEYKNVDQLKFEAVVARSPTDYLVTVACALPDSTTIGGAGPESSTGAGKSEAIGSGTGWYVDAGYVVTAYHVVEGKKRILLYGVDRKPIAASVVSVDSANDIAILDANFSVKPGVALSLAKTPVTLGAHVFTIGFPHPDLLGLSPKFTAGDVSAITGIGDDPRVFQISVPVQAGNSGGPLINASGEVVGIVTAKLSADKVLKATGDLTQNVNYAIKARYLQGMLDDLGSRNKIAKPKSGSVQEIVEQIKGSLFLIVVE